MTLVALPFDPALKLHHHLTQDFSVSLAFSLFLPTPTFFGKASLILILMLIRQILSLHVLGYKHVSLHM